MKETYTCAILKLGGKNRRQPLRPAFQPSFTTICFVRDPVEDLPIDIEQSSRGAIIVSENTFGQIRVDEKTSSIDTSWV